MITVEFDRFWEWLLKKADDSDLTGMSEWLMDNFYCYLAQYKPNGWQIYIDDIYERGYLSKEIYREELEK